MADRTWVTPTAIFLGNGNGTFGAYTTGPAAYVPYAVKTADMNGDGNQDFVLADGSAAGHRIWVALGRGDGTFRYLEGLNTGTVGTFDVTINDFNGDGILDLASANPGTQNTTIGLGNGDGTFRLLGTSAAGQFPTAIASGDLNGDGVTDLLVSNENDNTLSLILAQTARSTTTPYLNLCTRSGALSAMFALDTLLERISSQSNAIGSSQSRLSVASKSLFTSRENSIAAHARISDIDVGEQSALYIRTSIVQQTAAALLAHSNRSIDLVLSLLQT